MNDCGGKCREKPLNLGSSDIFPIVQTIKLVILDIQDEKAYKKNLIWKSQKILKRTSLFPQQPNPTALKIVKPCNNVSMQKEMDFPAAIFLFATSSYPWLLLYPFHWIPYMNLYILFSVLFFFLRYINDAMNFNHASNFF